MNIPDWLETALASFDKSKEPLLEVAISDAIRSAIKEHGELLAEDRPVVQAEWAAFSFYEKPNRDSVWGTYFAPMMTATREDGTEVRSPDIAELNAESVAHWEERAGSVANPVMRARYADVVWDLKKAITKSSPSHKFAQIAIDAYVEATEQRLYTMEIEAVGWLRRALDTALSLRDMPRAKRVIGAIFSLYDAVAAPAHVGVWVFPFDVLYGRKDLLTPEQDKRLISDLEAMLAKTSGQSGTQDFNPHGAEAAAERLAAHYKHIGDVANSQRVIRTYGEAFSRMSKDASPILATAWLQPVIERYEQEGLKKESEELQLLASDKAKDIASDMKTVAIPVDIKRDEVSKFIEEITGGSLREALYRIAAYFIPKVAQSKEFLETMKQETPFLSMISVTRVDTEGRPVGRIGSIDEDPEGRLHEQLGQSIGFQQPFLVLALDRLRERYNPTLEDILSALKQSPLFDASDDTLLREGLIAYWDGDFVKAIHVLVPQIEHIFRNLLALLGIPTVKTVPRHPGILDVKNMNDVLSDERVQASLTEDIWRYFTVVYIDRKGGLNLRNDLAHGIARAKMFNRAIADRVFHSLLVLSLIRMERHQ